MIPGGWKKPPVALARGLEKSTAVLDGAVANYCRGFGDRKKGSPIEKPLSRINLPLRAFFFLQCWPLPFGAWHSFT